jgi:tRNA A37 threonylcarbamoyladenosine dehydratase
MTEVILKNEIGEERLKALIDFLKSWNIDAEVKTEISTIKTETTKKFTLAEDMWKDYEIDANDLRKEAWRPE